jgi:hypothetical protein
MRDVLARRLSLTILTLSAVFAWACGTVVAPSTWTFRIQYFESRGGLPVYPTPGRSLVGAFIVWAFPSDPGQQHATQESMGGTTNKSAFVYSEFGKWPAYWDVTLTSGNCTNQSSQTYVDGYQVTKQYACINIGGPGFEYDSSTNGYRDDGGTQAAALADQNDEYPIVPASGEAETLQPDHFLYGDDYVESENGQFRLVMQLDGNLVLLNSSSQPIWDTGTNTNDPGWAVMQADGNFVVYNGSNTPIWATGTAGNSGAYLAVLDNGTIMLFNSAGHPLWFSNSGS